MREGNATEKKQIDSLTGARFPAIMVIVCSHFEFLLRYPYGNVCGLFMNAQPGVDFFFMLSGFGMMLHSIEKNPAGTEEIGGGKGLLSYARRHVRKIYPLYIIMMLVSFPYFTYNAALYTGSLPEAFLIQAGKFVLNLTLLQSLSGMVIFSHGLNGVSWFLSSLFCIYCISPLLMRFLKRKIRSSRTALAALAGIILFSCVLAAVFDLIQAHTAFDDLTYGSPYRRVLYVAAGMLTAQIYDFRRNSGISSLPISPARHDTVEYTAVECMSVGSSMVWFFLREMCRGEWVYLVDMMLTVWVLYTLSWNRGAISALFSRKKMVHLGRISMYIFLIHYPVRLYIGLAGLKLGLDSPAGGLAGVVVILVLTFLLAAFADVCSRRKGNMRRVSV